MMKILTLQLKKDLNRSIKRGHPWVYADALKPIINKISVPSAIAKLNDKKNNFLAWGYYDPKNPIAFRVISLKQKLNNNFLEEKMQNAYKLRKEFFDFNITNAFRLFNGEGDNLPGLICDVYDDNAVLQFDSEAAFYFWQPQKITTWLTKNLNIKAVFFKARKNSLQKYHETQSYWITKDKEVEPVLQIKENNINFLINIEKGQKTGFFLDQRDNRQYIKNISRGKSILNLFAYTGGFSIYAAKGGAKDISSIDIAKDALNLAQQNWQLNQEKEEKHHIINQNVFNFLQENKNKKKKWDLIIVDPPSFAPSEEAKQRAINKYIDLFSNALSLVTTSGEACFSSCSSHINFEDFYHIIIESISKSRRRGIIRSISGQGNDHPFPLACPELRYLKFFHINLVD